MIHYNFPKSVTNIVKYEVSSRISKDNGMFGQFETTKFRHGGTDYVVPWSDTKMEPMIALTRNYPETPRKRHLRDKYIQRVRN